MWVSASLASWCTVGTPCAPPAFSTSTTTTESGAPYAANSSGSWRAQRGSPSISTYYMRSSKRTPYSQRPTLTSKKPAVPVPTKTMTPWQISYVWSTLSEWSTSTVRITWQCFAESASACTILTMPASSSTSTRFRGCENYKRRTSLRTWIRLASVISSEESIQST